MAYKLIGAKENETSEETIIRCANNLVKALLAGGYSLHSTSGVSGCEISIYNHCPNEIKVQNILSHWKLSGRCGVTITFKQDDNELELDE